MKKIIITGVSSFIGVHLAKFFSKNFNVYGTISMKFDDYNDINRLRLKSIVNNITFLEDFNLMNHDNIRKTISDIKPDYFIHHAGWTDLYTSLDYDLVKGFKTNVMPLSALFSSLKENNCKGIILTGSSAEYSDGEVSDLETDICYPSMPYGFLKLSQSIYAKQLSTYYNLPTRIARVYIPFGPFDSPNKLIPYVITNLYNNQLAKLSPCTQIRDFIYIDELVKIYKFLLSDLINGNFEIYNCASGNPLQLRSLLVLIAKEMKKSTDLLSFSSIRTREGEQNYSCANFNKLNEKYNGITNIDIADSLKDYINYFIK